MRSIFTWPRDLGPTPSVRDLYRAFTGGIACVEDQGRCMRNARSVAVNGLIDGPDSPRFSGGFSVVTDTGCCPSAAPTAPTRHSDHNLIRRAHHPSC
jgi:hypothetical protein